jgi:hypothetical protein
MRADLTAALQDRWEISLRERAQLGQRSIVPVLDSLLAAQKGAPGKIGSTETGNETRALDAAQHSNMTQARRRRSAWRRIGDSNS